MLLAILINKECCLPFQFYKGQAISHYSHLPSTTLMAESEEELKNLLSQVKEESEKLA